MTKLLDEMVETFAEASGIQLFGKIDDGLRAVLKDHVQKMLKIAVWHGEARERTNGRRDSGTDYADRIVRALTAETPK